MRYELLLLPDEMSPLLNLDVDQDGSFTIEEAKQKESELKEFVSRGLSVKADGAELQAKLGSMEMIEQGLGIPMIKLNFDYNFGKEVKELAIKYNLLFTNVSPTHHNFATITSLDGSTSEHDFDRSHPMLKLYMDPHSPQAIVDRMIKIPSWILLVSLLLLIAAILLAVRGLYLKKMKTKRRRK
ncbi:hypothetical protein ACFQ88_07785 [Paenibacillus sp. NPDC056579]|uniref:hypothetical protein n=1 Tax=Paenibacillus sp. NPDC056579 TaxID=3345871 RepID=UPI00368A6773